MWAGTYWFFCWFSIIFADTNVIGPPEQRYVTAADNLQPELQTAAVINGEKSHL